MALDRVVIIRPHQKNVEVMSVSNVKEKFGITPGMLEQLVETGMAFTTEEGKPIYFDEVLMPPKE